MNLLTISARSFKLFDDLFFEFPQQAGLYLLTGENRDRPELGSNAVAKSSLWDAVCFAFCGVSARGLRGPDLVRDGENQIYVAVNTDLGLVERTWYADKKNSLKINGQEVSQEEVSRIFTFERDTFIATTVIPQRTPLFVDLPAGSQVAVLQRLLSMERWVKYADKATKTATELQRQVESTKTGLGFLKGELGNINFTKLETEIAEWDEKHTEHLKVTRSILAVAKNNLLVRKAKPAELEALLEPLRSRDKRLTSNTGVIQRSVVAIAGQISAELHAVKAATTHIANIEALVNSKAQPQSTQEHKFSIRSAEAEIERLRRAGESEPAGVSPIRGQIASLRADSSRLEKQRTFYNVTAECPTCTQVVGAEHKEACLSEITKQVSLNDSTIKEHEASILRIQNEHTKSLNDDIKLQRDYITGYNDKILKETEEFQKALQEELSEAQLALEAANKVVTDLRAKEVEENNKYTEALNSAREVTQKIAGLESQLRDAKAHVTDTEVHIEELNRQLEYQSSEVNPLRASLERAQARKVELETTIEKQTKDLGALERAGQASAVWQKGFKSIRSQLISDALHQFGIEIAGVLEDLGLVGWSVTPMIDPSVFDTARVQTGFRYQVMDPDGVERVLDAFSGGEYQRIALAIQLGLGALIAESQGAHWSFEVWDEPSTYMSEEGILGLFRSLRSRAERLGKVIWVIDHHQVHYAEISRVYNLVRQHNKVTIQ